MPKSILKKKYNGKIQIEKKIVAQMGNGKGMGEIKRTNFDTRITR